MGDDFFEFTFDEEADGGFEEERGFWPGTDLMRLHPGYP